MAYVGSKGWYISELKRMGIKKHPVGLKKLELYRTAEVRNLYLEKINNNRSNQ
ncbi:hypothetical protein BN1002_02386 [Bacillus sp. B-jedd]|nr:DUF2639 domain-containing protein [Bacillus sp. B-jedd]CEG27519.1 hypothetical protein BN1002_02386 [Bacillus sp. B-jedd]